MYHILLTGLTSLSILACSTQEKHLQEKKETAIQKPNTVSSKKTDTAAILPAETVGDNKNKIPSQTEKMSGVLYFKEGESLFLKDHDMTFTFAKMLEDSRCPKEVNCVWEGVATAQIELMGTYTRPVKVKLSTQSNPQRGYDNKAYFNGYQYTLVQADPYPTAGAGFSANSGKYVIGIKVEKVAQNTVEPSVR